MEDAGEELRLEIVTLVSQTLARPVSIIARL
jgi:hypothetical protein